MKYAASALLTLALVACASSSGNRPTNIAKPEIVVRQAGSLFFGSLSSTPISIDVTVTNRANVPIRLREVQLSSPGMVQYTIIAKSQIFNELIAPGETKTVGLVTTAVARQARLQAAEPLALRTFVRFQAPDGKQFSELSIEQFAGPGI